MGVGFFVAVEMTKCEARVGGILVGAQEDLLGL